ncbi:SPFH domain-containing protein [Ruminococcus flavefaciens]|uniref:SPFH domain-containing protein n=1 Tax=Ruminococcus flavefaciens TaxID=1265 RepID=UPI0002ED2A9D|nr:SPFH domain-containing protein [Ruminococcus flavefaciens]
MGIMLCALIGLEDQEVDVYYCDPMPNNILIKKAQYRSSRKKKHLSQTQEKAENRIIKDGSKIIVSEGQYMIFVSKGMVTEICTMPGEYKFGASSSYSSYSSSFLNDGEKVILKEIEEREKYSSYGRKNEVQADVFYLNGNEILNNKFGCEQPISFCEHLSDIDSVVDVHLIWSGEFSFKIANPARFYSGCGLNLFDSTSTDLLKSQLKHQLNEAMEIALVKLSKSGINHNEILLHKAELYKFILAEIEYIWLNKMGIKLWNISPLTIHISQEDEEYIRSLKNNVKRDFHNATVYVSEKGNEQNMAHIWKCSCGTQNTGKYCSECGKSTILNEDNQWICECQTVNYGKYCIECGKKKPPIMWKCSCGALNDGKFCIECGKKRFFLSDGHD